MMIRKIKANYCAAFFRGEIIEYQIRNSIDAIHENDIVGASYLGGTD